MLNNKLLPLVLIHGLSLLSPGPDVFFVLSAASLSLQSGALAAGGIFLGNAILVLFVVFAGSELFVRFPHLFFGLKVIGALYLCYLGLKICLATYRNEVAGDPRSGYFKKMGSKFQILNGCLMCLTNPKAVLYFTSLLPIYLFIHGTVSWLNVAIVLMLSFAWFFSVAIFGNRLLIGRSENFRRGINFAFGGVLFVFSILIITSKGGP